MVGLAIFKGTCLGVLPCWMLACGGLPYVVSRLVVLFRKVDGFLKGAGNIPVIFRGKGYYPTPVVISSQFPVEGNMSIFQYT